MKNFFTGLLLPILFCVLFFGAGVLVMSRAGEYMPLGSIIDKQEKTDGLFGAALRERTFLYKKKLYARYPADITVIGSSRAQIFEGKFFKKSFINLGTSSSLDRMINLSETLLKDKKPKLVIATLDWWWLSGNGSIALYRDALDNAYPELGDAFALVDWLKGGKITPTQIKDIVLHGTPDIGITAAVGGNGFARDGSYHYDGTALGKIPSTDPELSVTLKRVRTNDYIFAPVDKIPAAEWKKFDALLDFYQHEKIPVIFVIPPVAPSVVKEMKLRYVDTFRREAAARAAKRGLPLYDFHDFSKDDCEFTDGYHGGKILYRRMLIRMADHLGGFIDLPKLQREVAQYQGRTTTLPGEVDFLGLGCKMKPHKQ